VAASALSSLSVHGQAANASTALDQSRRLQLSPIGDVDPEDAGTGNRQRSEAPAAFDNQTNGFDQQGPDISSLSENNVKPLRSFNDNRFVFEEVEGTADGLGPTYNAQSCRECHQNVVTGGASQVTEQRTGHKSGGNFFESQGGSLIQSRATYPEMSELVAPRVLVEMRKVRMPSSTAGGLS